MSEEIERQFKKLDEDVKSAIAKELAAVDKEMKVAEEIDKKKGEEVKALLQDAGVKLSTIDEFDRVAAKNIEEVIKVTATQPLKPVKNSALATAREVAIARGMLFPTSISKRLTPPAYSCDGSPATDAACVCQIAECNPLKEVKGTGWYGRRKRKVYGWFWWLYVPPKNGALYIYPRWSVHGAYRVYADDHWWSSTHVHLKLTLMTNVYQWYWDGWDVLTALDIGDQDLNVYSRLDRGYTQHKSLHVTVNTPVWILTEFLLELYAKSKYAYTRADFRTGVGNYIRVPWVWTYLI